MGAVAFLLQRGSFVDMQDWDVSVCGDRSVGRLRGGAPWLLPPNPAGCQGCAPLLLAHDRACQQGAAAGPGSSAPSSLPCGCMPQGNSALHHAVREGHSGVVTLLLRCGLAWAVPPPGPVPPRGPPRRSSSPAPSPSHAGHPCCAAVLLQEQGQHRGAQLQQERVCSGQLAEVGGAGAAARAARGRPVHLHLLRRPLRPAPRRDAQLRSPALLPHPAAAAASSCSRCTRRRCTWRRRRGMRSWRVCCCRRGPIPTGSTLMARPRCTMHLRCRRMAIALAQ